MPSITIPSPAKINLFLAITGRRKDGFHDLVSLAAPLTWGDTLRASPAKAISLTCSDPALPIDESNLVLKAAAAYRAATGWRGGAELRLEKAIPVGAGLGGGSSNAVAALRALNRLAGDLLPEADLLRVATSLGADCALFVGNAPVVMRGKGDQIESLSEAAHRRIRGQRVLLFKPGFGISTPWAYQQLASTGTSYLPAPEAEARLAAWREDEKADISQLFCNNLEAAVFAKYPALAAMRAALTERFGLSSLMSGSGSASFALIDEGVAIAPVEAFIQEKWGPSAFVMTGTLA